ncbi:MAG: Diaminopimelate epimerase [Methanosaeta sp. PtaU1.Bin112]|nr:MAG: Diaminopimelate epimerase [Methanosaeta sp. PtaU1.Bin112]
MKLADISEIELDDDPFRPRGLSFTKLHGNGNDFILIDETSREQVAENEKKRFAIAVCHRHFGIGADGVLFLINSSRADLGMRLIQPDGSEAEMCGNGIRCLAKYAWDTGYVGEAFDIETLAGIIPVQVRERDGFFWTKVDMGTPKFDRPSIPACGQGELISEEIEGSRVSAVNTGVPHAVLFVEDMNFDILRAAPSIRHNSLFPEGANVNFVKVGQHLEIRTFERGVEGETLSCGTGSVAAASVAHRMGLVDDEVLVQTKGGPLLISFEDGKAFMEGPAVTVCSGELSEEYLWNLSMEP